MLHGSVNLLRAASLVMQALFNDWNTFNFTATPDGTVVVATVHSVADASRLHGNVSWSWVGNTLVCCVQVDPAVAHDVAAPRVTPVLRMFAPQL